MATYTIKINLDNAAFDAQEGAEVAAILRNLADDCDDAGLAIDCDLRDVNGNTVGAAKRTGK